MIKVYDYSLQPNGFLAHYKIKDLSITHSPNEIKFIFHVKEAIPTIWLAKAKLDEMMDSIQPIMFLNKRDVTNNNQWEIVTYLSSTDIQEIVITSRKGYNLQTETGIIVYYDTNTTYNDEILDAILTKQVYPQDEKKIDN